MSWTDRLDRRDETVRGRRVRLIRCSDAFTRLEPGQLGTAVLIDGAGTLHVDWDDGHILGLVPGLDEWELVGEDGA